MINNRLAEANVDNVSWRSVITDLFLKLHFLDSLVARIPYVIHVVQPDTCKMKHKRRQVVCSQYYFDHYGLWQRQSARPWQLLDSKLPHYCKATPPLAALILLWLRIIPGSSALPSNLWAIYTILNKFVQLKVTRVESVVCN